MDLWVTGGAWISAGGYGLMSEGAGVELASGPAVMPPAKDVFSSPHSRYGRFDDYTKLGCAAVSLTLKDAAPEGAEGMGMIVSTLHDVLATDMDYYRTTLEEGGALASPNLFSYTLPVIVLGECAVLFGLTGPTFCVGEEDGLGMTALENAAGMIRSGKAAGMLAGWIDAPPAGYGDGGNVGAIFVMLDAAPRESMPWHKRVVYERGRFLFEGGTEVTSLTDLFYSPSLDGRGAGGG